LHHIWTVLRSMPWGTLSLNDGHTIPQLAFGTWRAGNGDRAVQNVRTALDLGFVHVGTHMSPWWFNPAFTTQKVSDTAHGYKNEVEAGHAIRQHPRDSVFVTTKWSSSVGLTAEESIHASLKNVRNGTILACS
jgi:diketogulonate reductase-like aldo/keto reductase